MSEIKLNIGSGYKKYNGFTNIDGDKNCNPDILMNLDDVNLELPFENNSVSEIKVHHFLEHVGEGYFKLLQEIYRVCKSGAIIDIRVPYAWSDCQINDPTHKRPITVEGLRLFSKKYNNLEIERGGSSSTLGIMFDVDFEIIDFSYVYDSFYNNVMPNLTQLEQTRVMREGLNTAIETVVKLMVIKE